MFDFFTLNHCVKPPKGDCIQCSAVYVSQFSNTEISLVGLFASRLLLNLYNFIGQELLNFFHRVLRIKSSPNNIFSQIYQYTINLFYDLEITIYNFMVLEFELKEGGISNLSLSKYLNHEINSYIKRFSIHYMMMIVFDIR